MSKKISEMPERLSLEATDVLTGLDLSAPLNERNIRITQDNLLQSRATTGQVDAVQTNLDTHVGTGAGTAHPDGVTQTDLSNHKVAGNQHPQSGVIDLVTDLAAKANTADLGTAATRDVGTLPTQVAAGDAPANSTSAHDGDAGAHSGVLNTAAQKAALDANATLNGGNPVASLADIPPGGSKHIIQDEGTPLTSRLNLNFAGLGVTATDDAANNATLVTIPGAAGGSKHVIEDEGVSLPARTSLNFIGAGVTATDNAGNDASDVTIPGAPVDDVTGQQSIEASPTTGNVVINLVNDVASPGNNKVYGTTGAGVRGWKDDPTGGAVDSVSGSNTITASPTTGAVIVGMVNDLASPGNNKVYGTDGAGVKGWKDDPAGGGWQDGTTITDWGNTEQVLGSLGAGTSAVDLDNGHIITATLTADRTFNFSSTAAHGATDWSATIATGGNTPTFQFGGVAITTPPDYDISTAGTYVFFFTRNSLGTFVSERRMT